MKLKQNYPKILLVIYIIVWIILAIKPNYRSVWIDENILTAIFISIFIISYRWFKFSNTSYSFIFVFMVLHAIGGHYSYNEMPLFDWIKNYFGLARNHYDRIVHFMFGFLFFLPVYEFLVRIFKVPKGWRAIFLTFFCVAATKGIFELIEYGYVWVRADSLNITNYLGEQGDVWDSQKDVFLGVLGGAIMGFFVWIKEKKSHY